MSGLEPPRGTRVDRSGRLRYKATGPAPKIGAEQRLSALPSPLARALAFASILVGGACGGLIGFGVVRAQDPIGHTFAKSVGAIVGALVVAIGTAVLAVLVLRAMGEWSAPSLGSGRVRLGDEE